MGLLLFWNGIEDGVGTITSISELVGDGLTIVLGDGAISCVSELDGAGAILHIGIGSIECVSVLLGEAVSRQPDTTYIFTVVGQDGAAYSFTEQDGVRYTLSRSSGGRVEYRHGVRGRQIP